MGLTGFDPLRSVTRLRSSGAIAQCERAQDAPLRQQPDTSRDDQCQRDQSPLGPTMTASAVFVKRDRTPVNGKHDHPSGARPPTALGVRGPRRRIVFNDDLIRTAVVSDRVVLTTANYNEMV